MPDSPDRFGNPTLQEIAQAQKNIYDCLIGNGSKPNEALQTVAELIIIFVADPQKILKFIDSPTDGESSGSTENG